MEKVQIFSNSQGFSVSACGEHLEIILPNINKVLSEYDMLSLATEVERDEDFDAMIRFLDRFVPCSNDSYVALRCAVKQQRIAWEIQNKNSYSTRFRKTYLMVDSNTGLTKIGFSVNPKKREVTLQSEKPTISLLKICDNNVEHELHVKYATKRVRGEWFRLSNKDIDDIVSQYGFAND